MLQMIMTLVLILTVALGSAWLGRAVGFAQGFSSGVDRGRATMLCHGNGTPHEMPAAELGIEAGEVKWIRARGVCLGGECPELNPIVRGEEE